MRRERVALSLAREAAAEGVDEDGAREARSPRGRRLLPSYRESASGWVPPPGGYPPGGYPMSLVCRHHARVVTPPLSWWPARCTVQRCAYRAGIMCTCLCTAVQASRPGCGASCPPQGRESSVWKEHNCSLLTPEGLKFHLSRGEGHGSSKSQGNQSYKKAERQLTAQRQNTKALQFNVDLVEI